MSQVRAQVAKTIFKWENVLKIFVGNTPWTVSKIELSKHFSQFGPVADAEIVYNPKNGISRGFGYVTFTHPNSLQKAITTKNQLLEGRLLKIEAANTSVVRGKK